MMRLSLVVVVLMACVACAGSEENLRPGPYVGLALVGAGSTFDNFKGVDEDLDDGAGSPGIQAMLGYQMWDRAAVELVYEGGMSFEGSDTDIDINTLMAQGKLFLGVLRGEAFQPYLLGGLGWEWVSASGASRMDEGGLAARAGFGLQYYITEHLPVFLEYAHTIGLGEDVDDFHYGGLKLGIMYRW
ncbi:MAG: porin family protein [Planctomycetota bacterium]